MNQALLISHILIASIMLVSALGVTLAARSRTETKLYLSMMISFVMTTVSGIALLFVTVGQLGRVCATMTVLTLLVLVVRSYYVKRVTLTV